MHASKTLLQMLTYLRESNEERPAERFPSRLIAQCLFDARFEFKRSELREIFGELITLGFNPLTRGDYYERLLLENVWEVIS